MTEPTGGPGDRPDDPVLARRTQITRWVNIGQRVGYALFAVAMVIFFVGLVAGYSSGLTSAIVACLVAGSLILAPAIVFGYGVKAANRADREGTWE